MAIHIIQCDGVPDYVCRAAQEIIARLEEHIEVRHEVNVQLIAAILYPSESMMVLGECLPMENGCRIWVCGLRRSGTDAKAWMKEFADTIVHEFVHYEQWRDGRECTERGVKVRTRSLLKKMGL